MIFGKYLLTDIPIMQTLSSNPFAVRIKKGLNVCSRLMPEPGQKLNQLQNEEEGKYQLGASKRVSITLRFKDVCSPY